MAVMDYEDPADPSAHEMGAAPDDGRPEPVAWQKACAHVTHLRTAALMADTPEEFDGLDRYGWTPLYTADQMRAAIAAERKRLGWIVPNIPPFPPAGSGLPRYGLVHTNPKRPLSVPMADGYWVPWHLAEAALSALREFARELLKDWPDDIGVDGFELQDLAEKHGLLTPTTRHAPCAESADECHCLAYHDGPEGMAGGVVCYRRTALLTGASIAAKGEAK